MTQLEAVRSRTLGLFLHFQKKHLHMKSFLTWLWCTIKTDKNPPSVPARSLFADKAGVLFGILPGGQKLADSNIGLMVGLGTLLGINVGLYRLGTWLGTFYVGDDGMQEAAGFALVLLSQVIWSFRWRNRCERCAKHVFHPMKNSESMEVNYSETHHAYDTWKEEGTLVSREQKHAIETGKDHGRFRSLTTTTHRRVDYEYVWACQGCGFKNKHGQPVIPPAAIAAMGVVFLLCSFLF